MTVEQLISKLSEFPKEHKIVTCCSFCDPDDYTELEIYVDEDEKAVVFSEER